MMLLALLRCSHTSLSRVFTVDGRTYRVCLNCGRELEYDLAAMRETGAIIERPVSHPDTVAAARAAKSSLSTARYPLATETRSH